MTEWLAILERYGIAGVSIVAVIVGSTYVLRRLFAKDDGILTRVGERHIEYLDQTECFLRELTESSKKLTSEAEKTNTRLETQDILIERILTDRSATIPLLKRVGLHSCDVVERACREMGIDDEIKGSLEAIRRELSGGKA